MTRVWIVGGVVVVAVAVAAVLVLQPPDVPSKPKPDGIPAPRALSEQEIRNYLEVQPGIQAEMARVASLFPVTPPEDREKLSVNIDAVLRRSHLTRRDWDRLRRRVEYVVDVLRWEEREPQRREKIEADIRRKEVAHEAAEGKLRDLIADELKALRAKLDAPGPRLHDSDRQLAQRFWADLDRLAPRVPDELSKRRTDEGEDPVEDAGGG